MTRAFQKILERAVICMYTNIGKSSGCISSEWKGIEVMGDSSVGDKIVTALEIIGVCPNTYAEMIRLNLDVIICMKGVRATNFAAARGIAIDASALEQIDPSQLAVMIVQGAAYNAYYRHKRFFLPRILFRAEDLRARGHAREVAVKFAQELESMRNPPDDGRAE